MERKLRDLLALENPIYINIDRLDETTRKITISGLGLDATPFWKGRTDPE